ncbi:RcnB family protein [Mesorhizobium sp. CN2-181]|uniref:RcnB family protein n=1 Tax=Mesorhizobium yinganensis TaxID=3157707 RepID=UPI0032B82A9A
MKRLILTALACSMLAVPSAYADYKPGSRHEVHKVQKFDGPNRTVVRKVDKKVYRHNGNKVVVKKVNRTHWVRGNRVPNWNTRYVVRDYNRYGLYRPSYGQRWIKVDRDYLLIAVATGVIVGVAAAN